MVRKGGEEGGWGRGWEWRGVERETRLTLDMLELSVSQ